MNRAVKWCAEEIGCTFSQSRDYINVPEIDLIRLLEERDRLREDRKTLDAIAKAAGDEDAVALIEAAKKLPKTADGVRVVPGIAELWNPHVSTSVPNPVRPGARFVYLIEGGEWIGYYADGLWANRFPLSTCYSTREAAEQARGGQQK